MCLGDANECLILHEALIPLSEGRVGLNNDVVLPATGYGVSLHIHGVQFELIHYWLVFGDGHDMFNVNVKEV